MASLRIMHREMVLNGSGSPTFSRCLDADEQLFNTAPASQVILLLQPERLNNQQQVMGNRFLARSKFSKWKLGGQISKQSENHISDAREILNGWFWFPKESNRNMYLFKRVEVGASRGLNKARERILHTRLRRGGELRVMRGKDDKILYLTRVMKRGEDEEDEEDEGGNRVMRSSGHVKKYTREMKEEDGDNVDARLVKRGEEEAEKYVLVMRRAKDTNSRAAVGDLDGEIDTRVMRRNQNQMERFLRTTRKQDNVAFTKDLLTRVG